MIKVLLVKKEENIFHKLFDNNILALALNMCYMLIQKRTLANVHNNTDDKTIKLYKQYLQVGSGLEGYNCIAFDQAVATRKAQMDIQNAAKPRQQQHGYYRNNN